MQLGIALLVVGTVWLIFRKVIVRQQLLILRPLLRSGQESPEQRAKALERVIVEAVRVLSCDTGGPGTALIGWPGKETCPAAGTHYAGDYAGDVVRTPIKA